MSANSKLLEEMNFQQRWEFRRGDSDFDSSSSDSKSSLGGEPDHKRHKLVSRSVTVDNDETSRFQQKGNTDPAISGQTEIGKTEKGKRGRSRRDNLACNEKKRGSRRLIRQKKNKSDANEHAALNDLKNHMNSLLQELKVTRKNLLSWMREEVKKLTAEEKASASETKEDSIRGEEELQLLHWDNSDENAKVQYQNLFGKNIQIQYQNNFEEHVQGQNQTKFEENVQTHHLINLEENIQVQPQKKTREKVQMQHRNSISSGNGTSSKRSNKSRKLADSNYCTPELEHQVDYSRAIVLVTSTEEDREDRLALPEKSNFKSNLSEQNVQVQQKKSIVLGIRAQNCNDGSMVKSAAKGKKAAYSKNHCQVPDYEVDYSQAVAPEKGQVERAGLSLEPKFSSDSFGQVASSMYLTLPTVLTKPRIVNYRPDNSPFSYVQPIISQNPAGFNSERPNLILGSSSHLGYFQGMQPEERSRNYSQMSSRDISFFNQNSTTTSIMGNGFTVPFQAVTGSFNIPNQFGLENLPCENNHPLNLTMNEGAIRSSGGGYPLPEPYIANNFHSHSDYRADGRLMTYQESCRLPK